MLKIFTVPFARPAAAIVLLPAAATDSTLAARLGIVKRALPSPAFQTRNDLSSDPETTLLPSFESANAFTAPV